MPIDDDRIDDAILALLAVHSFEHGRSWKNYDFDALHRLQAKGLLLRGRGAAKSVLLTDEGLARGLALAEHLFAGDADAGN